MPWGLKRFQEARCLHFVTFSCFGRASAYRHSASPRHLRADLRANAAMVWILRSRIRGHARTRSLVAQRAGSRNPGRRHAFSQTVIYEARTQTGSFWQKRYYDRKLRDAEEFKVKLRYLHRNPVVRGLVKEPAEWKWSSYRHYALREKGTVEIESAWTATDRETCGSRLPGCRAPTAASTTRRTATDCTRPAERPRRTFFQRMGEIW